MSEQQPEVARLEADIKAESGRIVRLFDELGTRSTSNSIREPGCGGSPFRCAALLRWRASGSLRSTGIGHHEFARLGDFGGVTTVAGTMLGRVLTMGVESLAFGGPAPAPAPRRHRQLRRSDRHRGLSPHDDRRRRRRAAGRGRRLNRSIVLNETRPSAHAMKACGTACACAAGINALGRLRTAPRGAASTPGRRRPGRCIVLGPRPRFREAVGILVVRSRISTQKHRPRSAESRHCAVAQPRAMDGARREHPLKLRPIDAVSSGSGSGTAVVLAVQRTRKRQGVRRHVGLIP